MTTSPADTRLPRFFALIPCAGQGSRAGAPQPKQYQLLAGRAMVLHTLAAFSAVARLSGTLVVVAPGDRFFDQIADKAFDVAACGGASRADSVLAGLHSLRHAGAGACLLYTSPSPRDGLLSRMPSSA